MTQNPQDAWGWCLDYPAVLGTTDDGMGVTCKPGASYIGNPTGPAKSEEVMKAMVDTPVNTEVQHPRFCNDLANTPLPGTPQLDICSTQDTGEFSYVGSGEAGCNCKYMHGSCFRFKCKRVKYAGDPAKCCRLQAGKDKYYLENGKYYSCEPAYRRTTPYKNGQCDTFMRSYCKTGNNLFNDPSCLDWIKDYSSKNTGSAATDDVLTTVCSLPANYTNPVCGCVVAGNEIKQYNLPAQCADTRCLSTQAIRLSNQNTPCNIVQCNMNISQLTSYKNLSPTFKQQCSSGGSGNSSDNKTVDPTTTNTTEKDYTWLYILIGLIIAFFIICGVVYLVMGNSSSSDYQPEYYQPPEFVPH